ncbi:MAG TPA: TRAP transporter small permease [Usitatibacter sp.]|nr:TRAP transporter small permease [Usitatibacter sp.]
MTHRAEAGLEPEGGPRIAGGPLAPLARAVEFLNAWIVRAGALALLAASAILTYSVVSRYFFKAAIDWQDEAAVFCIVGAVFASSAYVQSYRGHIGIELLAAFLSPRANRVRQVVVDIASFAFCAFFAWKSWTLWHEAYVDKQITNSTWGPPLWIPYALMAFGISLLALQVALQVVAGLQRRRGP